MGKSHSKGLGARILHKLLWPIRFVKFVCMSIGAVVVVSSLAVSFYLWSIVHSSPQIGRLRFEDLQAKAVKEVGAKREDKKKALTWTPLSNVSRDFLYSVVTSEDAQFFEHNGFNYDALVNSLAENIRKREYAVDGSTISQQVSKNLFLQNEKSLKRKIQEYVVTKELESKFKKNEILELYLNLAELGPDIFGVNEASQAYFGKTPDQINAAEGTFIALMLPSPRGNYYKVYQNHNLTKQARHQVNRVLRDMRFREYITEEQYQIYSKYNFFKTVTGRVPAAGE
jgi:monofunctional biosynthetic peptidoglycan transglycosylase